MFGADDLRLAQELARRASAAIENARLYREAEERAEAARVLATIGDGVFLLDRGGRIRLWNHAAERITGLKEQDVLGRTAASAVPGWDGHRPACRSRRYRGRAGGRERARRDRRTRALAVALCGRLRGRRRVRVPRPHAGSAARVDAPGPRRDGLARAAHAARRDLRRGAHAPARRHRARGGDAGHAPARDRRGGCAARRDRERPPAREPARLRQAPRPHRAVDTLEIVRAEVDAARTHAPGDVAPGWRRPIACPRSRPTRRSCARSSRTSSTTRSSTRPTGAPSRSG